MTQEQIMAYVDGELGPLDALRFERAMAADPAIAAEVDRHRRLREAVIAHFAPVAEEAPPERLIGLLDRGDNVIAFPRVGKSEGKSGQRARYAALAATLVAGLLVGQWLPRAATGPIGERGGAVMAQGDLAGALNGQLASAGQQGAAYRIGVSFRSIDHRYCRTFTGAGGAGLGCHGDNGWTLERFIAVAPAGTGGAYSQAASPSAQLLAAAQDMMAGAPLDAAQEQQARDRGWK